MREIWKILGIFLLFAPALAQVNAVWVIRDYEIVGGELHEYVGTKTFPVNSIDEVRALADVVRREARPARWVYDPERGWVALQRRGYRMDVEAAVVAYRDAAFLGRSQFVIPVEVIEPEPSVTEWYARGVRELIGEGVTGFWGLEPGPHPQHPHRGGAPERHLDPPRRRVLLQPRRGRDRRGARLRGVAGHRRRRDREGGGRRHLPGFHHRLPRRLLRRAAGD